MHHGNKVDAPSGTALLLGQAAAEGRGIDLAKCSERGRDGLTGARGHGKIGFASLRGGTIAGDHDVIFAGPEEMLTLAHRAENRMIFARGVVLAARSISRRSGRSVLHGRRTTAPTWALGRRACNLTRTEERAVGKEVVRTGGARGWTNH